MQYRYPFYTVGQFTGPATFLYVHHGQGIRHLNRLLETDDNSDGDLDVSPADVHV